MCVRAERVRRAPVACATGRRESCGHDVAATGAPPARRPATEPARDDRALTLRFAPRARRLLPRRGFGRRASRDRARAARAAQGASVASGAGDGAAFGRRRPSDGRGPGAGRRGHNVRSRCR